MAIKVYTAFLKAPALLEPHIQIVQCHNRTLVRGGGSYTSAEKENYILQLQRRGNHRFGKKTGEIGNPRKNRDYTNNSFDKIG